MCGRFTRADEAVVLAERFGLQPDQAPALEARYNIAPGQTAAVIVQGDVRRLELMRWGLVPSCAKDEKTGYRAINARAEALTQKPMFKGLFEKRRCLVPADGFYEWQKEGKAKRPWRFVLKHNATFAFAGLWERWQKPEGEDLYTFTIITTAANGLVNQVHGRMPLILPPQDEELWLSGGGDDMDLIMGLLKPYPAQKMHCYPVSDRVNSAAHEGADLIEPLGPQPSQPGLGF